MYTLKSIARRGTLMGAAFALAVSVVVPAASVYADELNPLTERSLLLSSSAPGYTDTDGSGNTDFAPPGSGPNGRQTGETFSFKVSTDSVATSRAIKAFTLQYCTGAAGLCKAPGNNPGDADPDDDGITADANNTRVANSDPTAHAAGKSDLDVVYSSAVAGTDFQIFMDVDGDGIIEAGEEQSTGWAMATSNVEDTDHTDPTTGKNNYITLTNSTGISPTAGMKVQVVFNADADDYITNPGSGEFFVKLNTYDSDTTLINAQNDTTPLDESDHTVIDGGVTVANVMTDSIHITTKVLETMAFSVGTQNRDTVDIGAGQTHGICDPVQNVNNNRLNLGNPNAEYSLETGRAWDVNSYWRLSSNSSGGATVYYSGNTLANTVGDDIDDMPTEVASTPGTEQFGLGFVDAGLDDLDGDGPGGAAEAATWANGYQTPTSAPFVTLSTGQTDPLTFPAGQTTQSAYDEATGTLFDNSGQTVLPGTAKFKFLASSLTVPEPIAQQNEEVIRCATAKMRYVGNIAADTPAGVYTTKINYLAAPQY